MNLRSSFRIALAIFVMGLAQKASAFPYLVYQGTFSSTTGITGAESAYITTKLNANLTNFHKLPASLQKQILAALKGDAGTATFTMYLITDEVNVANYAFVLVDPSGAAKAKVVQVDGSNLTTSELQNNFINGFEFPTTGGLGVFRFSITHPTGNDPVTGNPASYILQAYGTGPINDTVNYPVVPKRAALKFNVVKNGVVQQTVNLPAVAAITSPSGASFLTSLSGPVFGYYFDDTTAATIGAASKAGSFSLALNPTLTELANNGGPYEVNRQNIGYILPIPNSPSDSNSAAYKVFVKSILALYP